VPTDPPSDRVLRRRCEIGDRIRIAREAAKLTQEEVRDATGVSRDSIIRVEAGTTSARLDWLILIADALGVELADLVR
jgi:transcriptional regulator with XRE-family HTH domain